MSNRQRLKRWHRQSRKLERQPRAHDKAKADSFYQSQEWRELRYKVLKAYGRRCMCCGSMAPKVHVDHIKPRSRFPHLALAFDNLQVLCEDCNMGKGAWDQTDWRASGKNRAKTCQAPGQSTTLKSPNEIKATQQPNNGALPN